MSALRACNSLRKSAARVPRLARALSDRVEADDRPAVGDHPPRSFEDWSELQLKRAEVGTLIDIFSEYGSNRRQETTYRLRDAVRRPVPNATVSSLLAAGAHLGHSTSRMNPNFVPYAYGTRAEATIIDLDHTVPLLRRAANLVRAIAFEGGQILFIGTRPDLRTIVKSAAGRIGKQGYYVSDRWIPGTLTNAPELFGQAVANEVEARPDLVVLLNPLSNITCIRECALAHIPTIGIIDSDADPRIVMYPIPANDESPQTAEIVAGILSIAGREGLALRMEDDVREEEMVQNEIDDNFWDELEKEQQAEAEENDGTLAELQYQAEHGDGFEEFQDPENSDDEERPRGQHFDY